MTNKLTAEQKRLVEELERLSRSVGSWEDYVYMPWVEESELRIKEIKKELGLDEGTR